MTGPYKKEKEVCSEYEKERLDESLLAIILGLFYG